MKIKELTIIAEILAVLLIVSCGSDDKTDFERHTVLQSLTVAANENGTLSISTSVTTNMRLIEFAIFDEEYKVVHDFRADVADRNDALKDTDGGFDVDFSITANDIPVNLYIFSVIAEDGTRFSKTIGEKYEYASEGTFYVSLSDNRIFYLIDGNTDRSKIDFQVSSDGTVTKFGDANIVENESVIISKTGIVATYDTEQIGSQTQVSGIVVRNVDINNTNF